MFPFYTQLNFFFLKTVLTFHRNVSFGSSVCYRIVLMILQGTLSIVSVIYVPNPLKLVSYKYSFNNLDFFGFLK